MSLYTTYRPKDWDSVIGQEHTTTILRNALKLGRVGHAYLFHGSRGTGKTTSARILAKAVNCTSLDNGKPCHTCENCRAYDEDRMLDVIEIDAASNTGVDNIRDLIDKARFEPNQGKYKVYIIDEVHMLSTGAFNALLKTLEQPPPHVKFILATTEIDKVPETIRSRTQRFDFRKITDADIIARLEYICQEEKVTAEGKALSLIARMARGGMRDAITLLEQNIVDDEVTYEHVRSSLMILDEDRLDKIIDSLLREDRDTLLAEIKHLREMHIHTRSFIEQMLYRLRDLLFDRLDTPDYAGLESIFTIVMESHGKLRSFPDGMMLIETTLLRALKRNINRANQESIQVNGGKNERVKGNTIEKHQEISTPSIQKAFIEKNTDKGTIAKPEVIKSALKEHDTSPILTGEEKMDSSISRSEEKETSKKEATNPFSFSKFLQHIKTSKPALMGDLKNARFENKSETITFIFASSWNFERVNTASIKNYISDTLAELFGGVWTIECRLEKTGGGSSSLHEAAAEIF